MLIQGVNSSPVILAAAQRFQTELKRVEPELQVSTDAWTELTKAQAEHLGSVGVEAARLARRAQLGTLDAIHIRDANRYITGSPRGTGIATAALAVGGVVAGAGVAYSMELVNRPAAETLTVHELVTALVSSVIGAVLLVVGIAITVANSRR
jgi:hypothetical protein